MTAKQYQIILDLYHEFNDAFMALPAEITDEFWAILYGRKEVSSIPHVSKPRIAQ